MLFNSYIFIFIFLPIILFLFFYSAQYSHQIALVILLLASLIFYGWTDYHFVLLIIFSITINFVTSKLIINADTLKARKCYLWSGIIFNLGLLSYFKYTDFFIQNINTTFSSHLQLLDITLPIGISFFTFTQVAFLVDCYKKIVGQYHILNYALFVTYFPHLIAGPIIHHKNVMPQFDLKKTFQLRYRNIVLGLTLFVIGLFKKTVLADNLAITVSPVFDMQINHIVAFDAWLAALSYTFELYFDFSGYSDMAIGLSLLFGIKLPVNFYSPYKALNIIEFWRRWNMTLSHFLRDYLYIPLGGNRKGKYRRYLNLMLTMLLGGLWHGASWTFVFWGFLHGFYLCINHGFIRIMEYLGIAPIKSVFFHILSSILTFISVVIAWVFFRAPDFAKAYQILHAMFFSKFSFSSKIFAGSYLIVSIIIMLIAAIIVWLLPNSYQFLRRYKPAILYFTDDYLPHVRWQWKPTLMWSIVLAFTFAMSIVHIQASSIFLYFRF